MATIKHKSIKLLRAQAYRLLDLTNQIVNVLSDTNILQYKVNATNPTLVEPSYTTIKLTATSARDGGTYAWEVVGGPIVGVSLLATTGTSVDLSYTSALDVDTVTIKVVQTTPSGMYPTTTAEKEVLFTRQGPAQSTRTLTLYKEATGTVSLPIPPTAPTGLLKYRFSDNTFPVNTTGWTTTAPSNPTLPVYFIERSVSTYNVNSTYQIDVLLDWTTPLNITQQGISPPLLLLLTTGYAYIFRDRDATTLDSPDITLTALVVNTPGTVNWTATAYSNSNTSLGPITLINGTTGTVKTLTSLQFTLSGNINVKYVKITATVGLLSDTITIYRGDGGSDALTMILSNEAHTVLLSVDGNTLDLTGADTLIKVFKGLEDITNLCTITATVLTGSITPATIGGTALNPVYTVTLLLSDVATVAFRTTFAGVLLEKVFTISKSKAGNGAGVIVLNQSGGTFVQSRSGSVLPATISLTTTISNILAPTYTWYKDGAVLVSGPTETLYTVPAAAVVTLATYKVSVTGTINGLSGQVREDSTTLARVVDGSSTTTVTSSNSNMTFTGPNTGYLGISFSGATCVFRAFVGATELTYAASGPNTFSATMTSSGATVAEGTGSGYTYTVPLPTAMSQDIATTTVTFTLRNEASVVTTHTKVITYLLSRMGATGSASTVPGPAGDVAVTAYWVVNSVALPGAPSVTTGTGGTLDSGRLASGSAPGNAASTVWYTAPPTGLLDPNHWLFMKSGTKSPTDVYTWTSPSFLATFKVGQLSALSADIGAITAGSLSLTGTGGKLDLTNNSFKAYNGSSTYIEFTPNGGARFTGSTSVINSSIGGYTTAMEVVNGANNATGLTAINKMPIGGSAIRVEVTDSNTLGFGIYAIATAQYAYAPIFAQSAADTSKAIVSNGVLEVGRGNSLEILHTVPNTSNKAWRTLVDHTGLGMYWRFDTLLPATSVVKLRLSEAGDLTATGNVTAYSDKAIKLHIRPISQATSKLKQINGYQYKNLLANKHDCGIIAQEIEKILPELVQVGSTEYEGTQLKTVNYNGVVALLVAANRELITRVEALEKQVHASTIIGSNKFS